jgi:hypothetical protein
MVKAHERVLRDLGETRDDDLLAILGASVVRETVDVSGREVVARFIFEKTAETIERGRRRLEALKAAVRTQICPPQDSDRAALGQVESLGRILEVIRFVTTNEPAYPVGAATILICRSCDFSLTRLCADDTH